MNSLVPGPKRYGKGEKKEEVDPKKLPSKSIHDTTFQGNLMDIGLDWKGDNLGRPRSADGADSKAPKTADAAGGKDSKVSKQTDAVGEKDSKVSKSNVAGGVDQNKDQKSASAAVSEKSSEKEKSSDSKPGGDH